MSRMFACYFQGCVDCADASWTSRSSDLTTWRFASRTSTSSRSCTGRPSVKANIRSWCFLCERVCLCACVHVCLLDCAIRGDGFVLGCLEGWGQELQDAETLQRASETFVGCRRQEFQVFSLGSEAGVVTCGRQQFGRRRGVDVQEVCPSMVDGICFIMLLQMCCWFVSIYVNS